MKPWVSVSAGAVLTLSAVLGVWWHGHTRYAAGRAQAFLEFQAGAARVAAEYRAQEHAARQQAEEHHAKYRAQILATQRRAADLDMAAGRLREQLANLQSHRTARNTAASASADGASGPDLVGAIGACAGRYDEVVQYAGRLADQVNGLQGYVRTVQRVRR